MKSRTLAVWFGIGVVGILLFSGFVYGASATTVEGRFQWEPQRIGDQGTYSVTLVDQDGRVLEATRPLWGFHLWDDAVVLDDDGREHHVLRIVESGFQGDDQDGDGIEEDWEPHAAGVWALDLASHDLVSYSYIQPRSVSESGGIVTEAGSEQHFFIEEDQLFTLNCPSFSPSAGSEIDLSKKRSYWNHCGWHDYWSEDMVMTARQMGEFDGRPAVVFQNGRSSPLVQVTLAEGIPYPVELLVEQQRHRGQFHLIRLESFTQGDRELPAPRTDLDTDPFEPLVESAWDRLPFGTIDGLPYPILDAIQAARGHEDGSRLDEFLDAHPDWYIFAAENQDQIRDGSPAYTWFIGVTDGQESLDFSFTEEKGDPQAGTGTPLDETLLELGVLNETMDRRVTYPDRFAGMEVYSREQLPERLPTLWSIESRWEQYAGDSGANAIAFRTHCTRGCENLFYDLTVEKSEMSAESGGSTMQWSRLRYMHDPPWGEQWDLFTQYHRTSEASPAMVAGDTADRPLDRSTNAALWAPPSTGFVATVGTVGTLGFLTVLFASVKGGAVGLFSRIAAPQVLENPVRQKIMEAVHTEPGIHIRALRTRLGIGAGAVDHHVYKLESAGRLRVERRSAYTCLFPLGTAPAQVRMAPVLKAAGAKAIIGQLRSGPMTQAKLAERTGLTKGTLSYHVGRLAEAGAVDVVRSGRSNRVSLTPDGRKAAA